MTAKTYTVTNTAKAPRGLHAVSGFVSLEPGQTLPVDLSDGEYASAKSTGYFTFDGGTEPKTVDDLDTTVAELKKIAEAEGIDLHHNATKAAIQDAIRAGRMTAATSAPSTSGGVDLDAMDEATLRATVAAVTGSEPPADADRAALIALARGDA